MNAKRILEPGPKPESQGQRARAKGPEQRTKARESEPEQQSGRCGRIMVRGSSVRMIKGSWDPLVVPRPLGSMAQGESWIPDHV